jgi:DNA-binding transcriptional LysR family regulator
MTLDQLRIFLAVADRCHVTQAAAALKMTQSAVSAALSTLESQHKVQLFDRVGRGITLTDIGRSFIEVARAVLLQAEIAELMLADFATTPRGHLRVQASQTVATYFLPPFLVRLRQTYPDVCISVGVGNTTSVARAVAVGEADLGFVEGDVREGDLKQRVIARDELVLIMRRDHPKAMKDTFSADDYRSFGWVLREEGSGTRAEVETHFARMGLCVGDLSVLLDIPSNEAVVSAVASGAYVSMLSHRSVPVLTADSGILRRRVTWTDRPERPFSVLSHPKRHRSRAALALMEMIDEAPFDEPFW